jgi:hypothetical protein
MKCWGTNEVKSSGEEYYGRFMVHIMVAAALMVLLFSYLLIYNTLST